MHGITNYIFVDDDKHIVSEIGFLDDLPAENYCGQLSVDLKTTITCYKEVCVLDYVKARVAEQRNGAEAGGSGLSSVSKPNLGEPCPHCKGKATINRKWYATTCGYCHGWGRVILDK